MPTPAELVQQGLERHRAGDLAAAEQLFRQALALDPNCADALHFLGTLAHQCDQHEAAIGLLTRALALKQSPRTLNNLGDTYRSLDRLDEAIRCFTTAISMVPTYAEAHHNLGVVLGQQMKLEAALASYAKALRLQPDHAVAHVNRGLILLQQGKYDDGWREYEWRHRRPEYHRPFEQQTWDGSPLNCRTLLLWTEQGFGDTIQFARFIPPAVARARGRVLFECQPEVKPLFHDMTDVEVYGVGESLPKFDVQCALMSLPLILRTTVNSIPQDFPYITPLPDRVARWRERVEENTSRKIGIAWASNALNPSAYRRSCKLSDFAPLANLPGVRFFSLQKGPAAEEAKSPPAGMNLSNFTSELHDFADTAALISQLDLVITVDTAVVHVAGAMKKPVWVLLPIASDWRWLVNREDSPWYPSARLFRQTSPGDWTGIIRRISNELRQSP